MMFAFLQKRTICLLAAALWLSLSAKGEVFDWPTFQHDPQHTGVSSDTDIAVPMDIKWTFATNGPIRVQPVVKDGVVYFGSTDHKFYAVDANSGRRKWSYIAGAEIMSSASVGSNGGVYFGCDDGYVYALDANTGALRWRSSVTTTPPPAVKVPFDSEKGPIKPPWPPDGPMAMQSLTKPTVAVIRAPVLAGAGMVFVGTGRAGSWGYLHGFDAETGRLRWKLESSKPSAYRYFGGAENGPVLYRDCLYWPSYHYLIMAVDPVSGERRSDWPAKPKPVKYETGHWPKSYRIKCGSQIAVNDKGIAVVGVITLGYGQMWAAVDLSDHSVHAHRLGWTARVHRPAPLLKGNLLYSTFFRVERQQTSKRRASITCYDINTRGRRFEWWTDKAREPFNRCLALGGKLVFGVTGDGKIYAISEDFRGAGSQAPAWTFDLKTPVQATAAIACGMYFIGTEQGKMHAFGK